VTIETIKHEDDIVYLTPDHHPDVYFADHFDHQVFKLPVSPSKNSLFVVKSL
jgi:hypothetical protein